MNAALQTQNDRALQKAKKAVEDLLIDSVGGLYISQITGKLQISADLAKSALRALKAVERNGLWDLPAYDEEPTAPTLKATAVAVEVVAAPAVKIAVEESLAPAQKSVHAARVSKQQSANEQVLQLLKDNRAGLTMKDLVTKTGLTDGNIYNAISQLCKIHNIGKTESEGNKVKKIFSYLGDKPAQVQADTKPVDTVGVTGGGTSMQPETIKPTVENIAPELSATADANELKPSLAESCADVASAFLAAAGVNIDPVRKTVTDRVADCLEAHLDGITRIALVSILSITKDQLKAALREVRKRYRVDSILIGTANGLRPYPDQPPEAITPRPTKLTSKQSIGIQPKGGEYAAWCWFSRDGVLLHEGDNYADATDFAVMELGGVEEALMEGCKLSWCDVIRTYIPKFDMRESQA